ncbi:DUF305 domain-containing protein [Mesorhizobium sp. B2-5-9]|uniref:CopM family metallochaperone n=1 Tax=unclassified Mesorhizobium TaxID=325217 RepID=UPI0011264ACF|nr:MULTISPECIES: DUF305 domain-containing protein [unclassified Mesorhizobium]TPJ96585.1 DUF305 domain-containing protein [Mesorhizobium sp. B2-5-9]TPK83649.1 DUF305 domain-containing protein [Mesorhizobium sp. B2-4-13]
MRFKRIALATLAFGSLTVAATAQEAALPDACKMAGATMDMSHQGGGMQSEQMDAAHKDMMAGMDVMQTNMMMGMMAKDIDVAFVCGMIPHHQGAIDMAKAELAHGKNAWTKKMAQKVIDAQTKEIGEMKDWLAKHKQQ